MTTAAPAPTPETVHLESELRSRHGRAVLAALLRAPGGLGRRDLAREARISRPTLQHALEELEQDGLVDTGTNGASARTPQVTLTTRAGFYIGVALGHWSIHVAVADANGDILDHDGTKGDYPVDSQGPASLLKAGELVKGCIEKLRATRGFDTRRLAGVGIGLPAPVIHEKKQVAEGGYLPGWSSVNVAHDTRLALKRVFSDDPLLVIPEELPVCVENDVNATALAELTYGDHGARDFIVVKVSGGVGAAAVVNGRLLRGADGVAGEFGHLLVDRNLIDESGDKRRQRAREEALTRTCPRCGRRGCVEMLCSTDALIRRLRFEDPDYPEDIRITDVIDNARLNKLEHPRCHRALVDAGRDLGVALAPLVTFLNPERVIVTGVLTWEPELVLPHIQERLDEHRLLGAPRVLVEPVPKDRRRSLGLEGAVTACREATAAALTA